MLLTTLVLALRELRRNAMRSVLTMLGIIIGVSAVIALISIGEGATRRVTAEIGSLGNHLLVVNPEAEGTVPARGFTADDVDAIQREATMVASIAPVTNTDALLVWGNENRRTPVIGTTADFLDVRSYTLAGGRSFTTSEQASGSAVCILGATTRKHLFGDRPALDRQIRVGKLSCLVVGLLEAKGKSTIGQDQDDTVLMPIRAAQRRLIGTSDIGSILVSARSEHFTTAARRQLISLLRQRRGLTPSGKLDFAVDDMREIANMVGSATGTLTALLGAIAAVSLVVGGIGIMNIMLVSVTERTREIGTRLAIGALAKDVLVQFLIEAIVLSALGGVIGIMLGLLLSWAITQSMQVPFTVQPDVMLLAFGFSALVGVLFGYLPARKAAALDPIEALRHE